MVRECRPREREPVRSWLARRSTMATSTPARASSPASISPVGPPPAMTTVPPLDLSDPPIRLLLTPEVLASAGDHAARPGACGKSPPWGYSVYGDEGAPGLRPRSPTRGSPPATAAARESESTRGIHSADDAPVPERPPC